MGFSRGTANVSPADVKHLTPIIKHIQKKGPHFHGQCMRMKGLKAKYPSKRHRAAICAVLKDLARGTTSWRKGRQTGN